MNGSNQINKRSTNKMWKGNVFDVFFRLRFLLHINVYDVYIKLVFANWRLNESFLVDRLMINTLTYWYSIKTFSSEHSNLLNLWDADFNYFYYSFPSCAPTFQKLLQTYNLFNTEKKLNAVDIKLVDESIIQNDKKITNSIPVNDQDKHKRLRVFYTLYARYAAIGFPLTNKE